LIPFNPSAYGGTSLSGGQNSIMTQKSTLCQLFKNLTSCQAPTWDKRIEYIAKTAARFARECGIIMVLRK
jgi:hypothetical protein